MINANYFLQIISSKVIAVALIFISTNGFCQIYESTRIDEYRVVQYDTLNVETVKEYAFYGKIKELKSIKKYDSDGFIVEQSNYQKERRREKLTTFISYSYNADRTECAEVWYDPSNVDGDSAYISTKKYALDGRILSKTERKSYSGEVKTFDFSYDDHGNCESIRTHGYFDEIEYFMNDYDSLGRIIRQVHTHRLGTDYERSRSYNKTGQIERNSMNDGQLVEKFVYNENGDISSRDYTWDSTKINLLAVFTKTCVDGSDHFEYDQNGRLISLQNDCSSYVNKEHPYFMSVGEKLEYDALGLVKRRTVLVSDDEPEDSISVGAGYFYNYELFQTKK